MLLIHGWLLILDRLLYPRKVGLLFQWLSTKFYMAVINHVTLLSAMVEIDLIIWVTPRWRLFVLYALCAWTQALIEEVVVVDIDICTVITIGYVVTTNGVAAITLIITVICQTRTMSCLHILLLILLQIEAVVVLKALIFTQWPSALQWT